MDVAASGEQRSGVSLLLWSPFPYDSPVAVLRVVGLQSSTASVRADLTGRPQRSSVMATYVLHGCIKGLGEVGIPPSVGIAVQEIR